MLSKKAIKLEATNRKLMLAWFSGALIGKRELDFKLIPLPSDTTLIVLTRKCMSDDYIAHYLLSFTETHETIFDRIMNEPSMANMHSIVNAHVKFPDIIAVMRVKTSDFKNN